MDDRNRERLARMPLAEAVLLIWRWLANEQWLAEFFERHRGRGYERVLSFGVLVHLIADALLQYDGSGRQSFERAIEQEALDASIQAAYGKLRRIPVGLSMAFLAEGTDRLQALLPTPGGSALPASLAEFDVVVLDGKAIKRLAKRLKAVRGAAGGVLGGKALVALSLHSGLAIAMHAHPDGDANDVLFVPDLLPVVRARITGRRLWLADRAFCYRELLEGLSAEQDRFVVRYRSCVPFEPDGARPAREGRDAEGRPYFEQWGWLRGGRKGQRLYLRRITLKCSGAESIILVTNLLEASRWPAADLLTLYLSRWGIERMFEEVTTVFGLKKLIGSTPEASVFQFAFCMLLYNLIQVVRAYVAAGQHREPQTISTEKLFVDVRRELIAWSVVIGPALTAAEASSALPAQHVRRRLAELLRHAWTRRWIKAPTRARCPGPSPPTRTRTHTSAYRILQAHQNESRNRPRRQR